MVCNWPLFPRPWPASYPWVGLGKLEVGERVVVAIEERVAGQVDVPCVARHALKLRHP